mgnify:CR=1 FL=1
MGPLPVGGSRFLWRKRGKEHQGPRPLDPGEKGRSLLTRSVLGWEGEDAIEVWDRPLAKTDLGTQFLVWDLENRKIK